MKRHAYSPPSVQRDCKGHCQQCDLQQRRQWLGLSGHYYQWGPFAWVMTTRQCWIGLILMILMFVLMGVGLTQGRLSLSFLDVMHIFLGHEEGFRAHIVWHVRLPRVVTAATVGAALGVSGAVFQSVSRNALGSPDIIGLTAGAASGALLQIVLFDATAWKVSMAAVAGGMMTAWVVYLLSLKSGQTGGYRLILTGIGVGAILTALNGLLLVKGELDNAMMANLWLAGSLQGRNEWHAFSMLAILSVVLPLMLLGSRSLKLLEMGSDMASALGVAVNPVRLGMLLGAVTLAAFATGVAGPIAFIALAAPQLALRLTLAQSLPLVSSACLGAVLLLLADQLTQSGWIPWMLPIGRVTGVIGGLYLLWLLAREPRI